MAQKPSLDEAALESWQGIGGEVISNDGRYILYCVYSGGESSLIIKSSDSTFQMAIIGGRDPKFTEDNRRVIYFNPGDSLCNLELSTRRESYIPHVRSFKLSEDGNGEWLAYQSTDNELVLLDLFSGEKKNYPNIREYSFGKSGKSMLLQTDRGKDSSKIIALQWIDLTTGKAISIWQGEAVSNITFDQDDTQLAFLTPSGSVGQETYTIWHYRVGTDSARPWLYEPAPGMENGFVVAKEDLRFSPDGDNLFFKIRRGSPVPAPVPQAVNVDIWNYRDEFLQAEQLDNLERENNRSFRAVIHSSDNKMIRLEQEQDRFFSVLDEGDNDAYLLAETSVNAGEGYRRLSSRPDLYLISTRDGSHTCIQKKLLWSNPHFSPGGKYVLWYNLERKAYFTYNIRSGTTKNITSHVPVRLYDELWDEASFPNSYNPAIWLKNDAAVLIYDRYDIWEVDPEGIRLPVNSTNGYGRRNKTVLRYVYTTGADYVDAPAIEKGKPLVLCGFNETNKCNGFFKKQLDAPGDPIRLILAPACFYFSAIVSDVGLPRFILKAKQADVYLVNRMSASESPNLQVTKDFRTFVPMSAVEPQKRYNWMTSELVHWTTFDGSPGEGILYKPEDFDPSKKYPIIFYFYERLSAGLNLFIDPEMSTGPINIPWFVSRDYLVFCPDIHYRVGAPGESVYNYVGSAAKMMGQKRWVDGKKMGIQGHSWGGYEVNYLVTKTGIFAAAASAAGPTDIVSISGILGMGNGDAHGFTEQAQDRMGATLWQNPATYIKNSPVFGADKVTTPILIMHNKKDPLVSWSQSVEFFTALRRLGKPSWMLQYDEGHHTIEGKEAMDYTTRLVQFFDHFLKGKPAPKWMTEGVRASRKGIDTGLELDTSGRVP